MIESRRLILRPHSLDDLEAVYALWGEPEVFRLADGKPLTRQDAWNRILRYAGHWSLLGYGQFGVFEKSDGRFVGQTGLADFHRGLGERFDPFPEAAWVFAQASHGKGYATEAALAAHEWFDLHHSPARTVCIIDPTNLGSLRVAEKLGYRAFGQADHKDKSVTMLERERL